MTVPSRATTTTDTPACSAATGGAGKCISCTAEERLGVQPKLHVNPPNDRWEQEADRIADQVIADRPAALTGPLPVTPLVQRQPIEEEEELLQASGYGAHHPPAAPGPAFARRVFAETGGGRPLDNAVSTYLEPRLRRSVSAVRVHDGPRAADFNRRINARAFTLGNHIFFGSGGLDPATTRGRRLLAHEIVHTFQQGAHRGVQRTPDDDPETETADAPEAENQEPEVYGKDRIDVHGSVTIREVGATKVDAIETPIGPVYPGDTVYMDVRVEGREATGEPHVRPIKAPVDWTLPAGDLELAEQFSKGRVRLRVTSDPASLTEPKTVEATVNSEAFAAPVTIRFVIEAAPEEPSVVDPEGAVLEESLGLAEVNLAQSEASVARRRREGRTDRRERRKEARQERRELRKDQRSRVSEDETVDRDFRQERRDLREEQRLERRELRKGQRDDLEKAREERGEARGQVRSLSGDLRRHNRQSSCTVSEQRQVETALKRGAEHAARAVSAISPGAAPDRRTRSGLRRFFKLDASSADPEEIEALLQRNVDVLNVARNSMLTAQPDQFVCSSLKCDETSGAFVVRLQRGAEVTICRRWLDSDVSFEVTSNDDEAQAYALLHEFIHLSGISTVYEEDEEAYVGSEKWRELDHGQTLLMADAYASFGWFMGKGGT